jgi:hypothetical protein
MRGSSLRMTSGKYRRHPELPTRSIGVNHDGSENNAALADA